MVTLILTSVGTLQVRHLTIFRLSVVLIPIAYTIVSFASKTANWLTRIHRGSDMKSQTKSLSVHVVCLVASETSVCLSEPGLSESR